MVKNLVVHVVAPSFCFRVALLVMRHRWQDDALTDERECLMTECAPTAHARLRHCAHKACYERAVIAQHIDSIPACTMAINDAESGQPRQMVSSHWRIGDALYIHASNGNRFCRQLTVG